MDAIVEAGFGETRAEVPAYQVVLEAQVKDQKAKKSLEEQMIQLCYSPSE